MNYITDPLIQPYKIGLDENQYVLMKDCVTESGKDIGRPYEQPVGYYASLGAAIQKVSVLLMMNKDYGSIGEYLDELKTRYTEITQTLKDVINGTV